MLAELFQAWKEEVEAASGTRVKEYDRYKDRIVTRPDGAVEVIKGDPAPRKHNADDLDTLRTIAEVHEGAVCWVNRAGVVVVLDDLGERKNTVTMQLRFSPQLVLLHEIEKGSKAWTQKDLINLLRIRFRGCGIPDTLIDMLRKVRFKVNTEGEAEIQRGKTSVGKSHLAEFHGLQDLPEWIQFQVPVWDGKFQANASVEVALDPDPESQTFRLVPRLGGIEKGVQGAEQELLDALRHMMPKAVPVYYGAP